MPQRRRADVTRLITEFALFGPADHNFRRANMTTVSTRIVITLVTALVLTSCGNTIRGVGRDTSNAVDATQDAARDVAN
jgi:predicted small secreted protein